MGLPKERLETGSFLPIWVKNEHLARYHFAAQYVVDRTVIDCACGDGTGSQIFAKAGAKQVLAFDADANTVSEAAKNKHHPRLSFATGSANQLPVPDHSADVYISLETIEHLDDDRAFVSEAVRALCPSGAFICSTPNRFVTNPGSKITDKPFNPFHVREYNRKEFSALLGQYFDEIAWFGQNRKCRPVSWVMNCLGGIGPFRAAVRINQMAKLPRFLFDSPDHHRVTPEDQGLFEFMVAVCTRPRTAA